MKYFSILLCFVFFQCKQSNKLTANQNYQINATIKGIEDSTRVFFFNMETLKPFDSTYVLNNNFRFSGSISEPVSSLIYFENKKGIKYPTLLFWTDIAKIEINAKLNNIEVTNNGTTFLKTNQITGSQLNHLIIDHKNKVDSISNIFLKLDKTHLNEATLKKSRELTSKNIFYLDSIFESKNPNNFFSVKNVYDNRNYRSLIYVRNFYEQMNEDFKNSSKGKLIKEFLISKKFKIGEEFLNIEGKTLDNKVVKLSDFKGKTILLDFWRSDCPPCRKQFIEEFPSIVQKYKKEDLVIVSFSIDSNYEFWKKASIEDNINWVNLSDLMGYYSSVIIKYEIQAIPRSFIIDKDGIIRSSHVGYKHGFLEKELDKIL